MNVEITPSSPSSSSPASSSPSSPLAGIRIVLVSPSHPGNVGAAARAMKVMGLTNLALVTPRDPYVLAADEARALASGAVDVLERASVHPTLAEALRETSHAVALSAREREYAPPAVALRDAAIDALARVAAVGSSKEASVAFVFGSERYGLSNDDVLRCQARCRVATAEDYESMNLAQAVQLVAYECRMAAAALPAGRAGLVADAPALANHDEREALLDHLERGLVAIGYLDATTPKKLMPRMRRLFARAGLEREEVQWLRGIAKAMLRADGTSR